MLEIERLRLSVVNCTEVKPSLNHGVGFLLDRRLLLFSKMQRQTT